MSDTPTKEHVPASFFARHRRRWMAASQLAVFTIAGAMMVAAPQCSSLPENCFQLSTLELDGYTVTYKDVGEQVTGPIVLLLSGDGDNTTVWRKTLPEISEFTRVIVYDRAGVGCSDIGPNPRTAEVCAAEIGAFLDGLGIDEPVLLVGHSMGGLYGRYFITKNPGRVAGIVLIDATSEYLENRLAEVLSPDSLDKQDIEYSIYFEAATRDGSKGEYYNRYNAFNQVIADSTLPDIPLHYLSAGNYDPGEIPADQANAADAVKEELDEMQRDLVPNGQLTVVPDTGHDIHIYQPQAVIDAVHDMWVELGGVDAP